MKKRVLEIILHEEHAGTRLDKVLAEVFPFFSRAFLQKSIKDGKVLVDNCVPKLRENVTGGERVVFEVNETEPFDTDLRGENLSLDIVYEDDAILVVNKAAGMVVHPATGHAGGTLLNGLIGRDPDLRTLPRGGIIHRLDKDTSGLLVVAKTREAHKSLTDQMRNREIRREYLCLVRGEVIAGGTIEAPLGRHPTDRKRIAVVHNGLFALTHYRIEQRFKHFTLLRAKLETGRTHQIRVHLAHIKYPVFGDSVYGGRFKPPAGLNEHTVNVLSGFHRQALHACELELTHPTSSAMVHWQAEVPQDMQAVLNLMDTH